MPYLLRERPYLGRGNTIMAMGDSITANGWSTTTPAYSNSALTYLMWTALYSKGLLRLKAPAGGTCVAATGGYTSAQILATHVPTIVAAKPAYCVVMAGTNDSADASSANLPGLIANLTAIYRRLLAAGIVPVLTTITPRNTVGNAGLTAINAWIRRYAQVNGLPCADVFKALGDPALKGEYLGNVSPGTYNGDNVHPSGAGAKLIGETIWNAVSPLLAQAPAPLASHNTVCAFDTANLIATATANALFLTDSNVDGIPNNWTLDSGDGTPDITTPASAGNFFTLTRGTDDYGMRLSNGLTAATAGDKMLLVLEIQSTVKGVSGLARVRLTDGDQAANIAGFDGWAEDIPANSVLCIEFSWPSGLANNRPRLAFFAQTATGAVVSIARPTLINLTAEGLTGE